VLIINADDLGRTRLATDRIIACKLAGAVSSASAMVFMEDSGHAAALAAENRLDTGLHLNLDEPFTAKRVPAAVSRAIARTAAYFRRGKAFAMIYNPLLSDTIRFLFNAQLEEFFRLHGHPPSHIDGHHHLHLCMNSIVDRVIPGGFKVRPRPTLTANETRFFDQWFGRIVGSRLSGRGRGPAAVYDIAPIRSALARLPRIVAQSAAAAVEIVSHPESDEQYAFLLSGSYLRAIDGATKGRYADL
jgi:hypothetical protein